LGQLDKAEPLYLKTLDIQGKTLGKEHPDYADILLNLALLYLEMGYYEKAESLFLESKSLIEKSLGKEHSQFAIILIGMANLYRQMGQYEKAEPLFLQAKAIQEKSLGKEHTDYASTLNNLALMYFDLDEYEKAEPLFLRAKFIREKAVGKEHPDYANSLQSLAIMYAGIGLYEKAEPLFLELSYANKRLIEKASRFLSERELNDYLKAFLESQNQTLSFTQTPFGKILIPNCYDNSLFYKGLLLQSAGRIRQLILSDTAATEKINRLKGYQRRLAALYTLPIAERDSALVGDLETQANDIEKDLTRSVAAYGQAKQQVNWQEVKATLKAGEAALEFVHYKYSDKKAMYSTMYAVFVLRAQDTTPHFIPLFEEKQLQSFLEKTGDQAEATSSLYAARTGNLLGQASTYGKELYNLIWRPLDSLMRGVKTVYFSPSGLLHRVAFAALPVDGKKVLSDKYELHQLGSTRSLVVKTLEPVAQNYTAAVFGGVQYDRKPNTLADSTAPEIKDNRLWTYINRQRAATNEGFDYLPGTAQEATRLTRALQAQRVQVQTFTAAQATEEMLKSLGRDTVKSPDILHIATHGFFFPDPEKRKEKSFGEENVFKWNENPLLRSGLALAGANAAWSGQPTLGNIEDGIATAYEISHLNLSNTKLVVLSACESGLGDIKGSEGVYGLQRAFKMAGADFLLVSLWQVPDKETVEFMNQFYQSWLGGKTIHEAFAKAQKKMRKKYKEVYKWGAWVLVE
jgi:CHAT domain-containing protein